MADPIVVWALEPAPVRTQLDLIAALDVSGVDAVVLPGASPSTPDPVLIASAASRRAPGIGLVPALSPWLQPPFHTARALGTLDALTSGRAGWFAGVAASDFSSTDDTARWNASGVTDRSELDAAGSDYLAAVFALYDSWEPGALIADVARGQYVDPAKVHVTDYVGPYVSVRGPLNMPRSPQGRPVVFAAASDGAVAGDADVVVVRSEAEALSIFAVAIAAGAAGSPRILLEVQGEAALELASTTTVADGYLICGVADGELAGRLLRGVLPVLLGVEAGRRTGSQPARPQPAGPQAARPQLLRDRLGLPAERFGWRARQNGNSPTGLALRQNA